MLARLPAFGRYLDEMRSSMDRIDTLVRLRRPDLIHAHSPVLNVLPALRVGRRHGIPVAYEMRASWEDAAVDHGSTRQGSLRYRLSRALETHALRSVDAITTICEGLKSDIVSRGIAAQRVTVIPNAVDPQAFAFDVAPNEALRAQLGLARSTVIGFAGSFYAYEGLDLLLQAVSGLLVGRRDLRVLLVGGGPQEAALRQQAQQLGLGDRVVFTGRVPHDQVQRYYDLIDVLAYPRHSMRLTELVTPLKRLEAMAQGRMFVASDVGGHRELIRDGDTGHLFRAGDVNALVQAIEHVLDGRADWDAMRRRARRHVENERTWERSVARYRDVYQRLLPAAGAAGVDTAAQRG
jgi:PEP-CTERM/exosortase A-associated glycosyltransferase